MKGSCTRQWHTMYFQSEIKRRQVRSSQGTCDSKGLGDFPTSRKRSNPPERKWAFFAYGAPYALLATFVAARFVATHALLATSIQNSGYNRQAMHLYIQMQKTIHSAFTERMVFLLVEAPPQAPQWTQSFGLRLRDSLNRLWRNIELESQFNI